MRKLIAAINMTLDGNCDHTVLIADDEIHEHYNELLRNSGTLLYGRITYQLMESYWPTVVKNPSGNKATDEFAVLIDNISKVFFSNTLTKEDPLATGWKNARLANSNFKEEVLALKQLAGKDIVVGSRSLIVEALNLNLVDEFQISVQPIIAGRGVSLLDNITGRINLTLIKTKAFSSGVLTFYYVPEKENEQ